MGKLIDLTGQRFGRLLVVERGEPYLDRNSQKRFKWLCQCDCGNMVLVEPSSLRKGSTHSCGCLQKEIIGQGKWSTTHGLTRTRPYRIWINMKNRCTNSKSPIYKFYGQRGIKFCEEWNVPENFFEWAFNNGYEDTLTLDRIDVNGNYEPENCRWVTREKQANNTRHNIYIEINGVSKTVSEWGKELNIKYYKIYRIYQKQNKFENINQIKDMLSKSSKE